MATVPETFTRLNAALDGLATALQSADAGAVLAAEVPLASAVQALTRLDWSSTRPDHELALTLLNTRLAVARCLRLGRASADLLTIVSGPTAYGPGGRRRAAASARSTVEARS